MKNNLFVLLLAAALFAGCNKGRDAIDFEGVVCGYMECTLASAHISDQDWGYFVALSAPDSVGKDFYGDDQTLHPNTVLLYSTRLRLHDGDTISGKLILDDDYSKAFCAYHSRMDIPEAVCYRIDN